MKAEELLSPWSGPCGGLPPFDRATPAALETAYEMAARRKREEVRAIAANPEPPSFENTIAALEGCGRELERLQCLYLVFSQTMSTDEMRRVERRLAPLLPALEDENAHDDELFARIEAVHSAASEAGLSLEQQRLVQLIRDRLLRRGAGLAANDKARLEEIHRRIAELQSRFNQNLIAEQDEQAIFLGFEAELDGLSEAQQSAMAATAEARNRPGEWAIANTYMAVRTVLQSAKSRELREKAWRMFAERGGHEGERDNRGLIAEMTKLRGEKARLLGYPTFAHFATANRMARTPDAALTMMLDVWKPVLEATRRQIKELQALADSEGAEFELKPWDRLYYAEKHRRSLFGLNAEEVRQYLSLDAVVEAMFWQAGRLYGLQFERLVDAPVCHPDITVFKVMQKDEPIGVLWLDLFQRPGKTRGSWQLQYRPAESFQGRVLPLSSINSGVPKPPDGEPALLPWEYANVFFHEFGHALHMLCCEAQYPSTGSLAVEWDFIELPSMLNERWLLDRELLERFARHHETGEPMPTELMDGIEAGIRFDRTMSTTVDLLAPSIADMRLYLEADGSEVDPVEVEAEVLRDLEMPVASDMTLRMPHAMHTFSDAYAAGVYSYLWADVMAADVAEAFLETPGGLWDRDVAERYANTILRVGASVSADQAFRDFRGRDPDPGALLRRFGLGG